MANTPQGSAPEQALGSVGGKGGGGESTAQAIALARGLSAGTLSPEIEALLPEGFGTYKWGENKGDYIFGAPPTGPGTSSTSPQGLQQAQSEWNRINVANPFGTSGYTTDEQGNIVLSSEFSPELQGLFQQITGMAGGQADTQYQEQAMTQARALLDPVFKSQREELAASLVARGLPPGSEQYKQEMAAQNQREQMAYNQAAFDAIAGGAQLEQQDYQQILALLSGMPTSPFQQIDVLGSFGPKQNELAMLLEKQMQDQANETAERGQNIQGFTDLVNASTPSTPGGGK